MSGQTDDLRSLISHMEASLASLCDWFCVHGLKLNVNKTHLIVFGSRPNLRKVPGFSVTLHDSVFQPREEVRNLGAIFDSALTWEAHVSELSRRCTGLLIELSHVRNSLPDGFIKGNCSPSQHVILSEIAVF